MFNNRFVLFLSNFYKEMSSHFQLTFLKFSSLYSDNLGGCYIFCFRQETKQEKQRRKGDDKEVKQKVVVLPYFPLPIS